MIGDEKPDAPNLPPETNGWDWVPDDCRQSDPDETEHLGIITATEWKLRSNVPGARKMDNPFLRLWTEAESGEAMSEAIAAADTWTDSGELPPPQLLKWTKDSLRTLPTLIARVDALTPLALRDERRQAGVHKPRRPRAAELDGWLDAVDPSKSAKELWRDLERGAGGEVLTIAGGTLECGDGGHPMGFPAFQKRVTKAKKRRK